MNNKFINGELAMGSNNYYNLPKYERLHLQQVRNLLVTIEVLDENLNTIDTIQGLSTGGSITVSADSMIRRTGSIDFILFEKLLPKRESLLWLNNRIRVYMGIKDMQEDIGNYTHFCQGTFYITEPSVSVSSEDRSISITLEDYMMKWEETQIETKFNITANTPLDVAMESTLRNFGENNIQIEATDLTVPYNLEFEVGSTVLDIITTLRDLYMDWECYYTIDGVFVFKKMRIQNEATVENPIWVFKDNANHITNITETFTYKGVKNKVLVVGQMDEKTGLTPKAEVSITDPNSPFHPSNIGDKKLVLSESLYTYEQCLSKARYELIKKSTMQEVLSISSIPIYYLDANDIILLQSTVDEELTHYVIDNVDIDLSNSGSMSISAHKLYFTANEIFDDDFTRIKKYVIDGITNKGWLSLSESRIYDYFGITGSGNTLLVKFENGSKYGVTAYVTGYTTTNVQTLTIDVADFDGTGDSGDTGAGKSEYADRIIGHEVFHVITNDYFGVNKMIQMPSWFKEGTSEFVHGADERLKICIVPDGGNAISQEMLEDVVTNAVNIATNGVNWTGVSKDYASSYLLVKYLDKKLSESGRDMKNFMASLKSYCENNDGFTALKSAIVENTIYSSYDGFVSDFAANGVAYVQNGITLDVGYDEVDTGSIGGIDHRGLVPLNAEDVFDNSQAIRGLNMSSMNIMFSNS